MAPNPGTRYLVLRIKVLLEAIGTTNSFELELVDAGPLDTEWLQARLQQREEALARQKQATAEARERAATLEHQNQSQAQQIKDLESQLDSMVRTIHTLTGASMPPEH